VKLIQKDSVELSDQLRWEVKEMRDIKHPNLCLFIGACIDTDHVAILNEVCGKGSLEDILSNDDIDLGWDFRYSMMKVCIYNKHSQWAKSPKKQSVRVCF